MRFLSAAHFAAASLLSYAVIVLGAVTWTADPFIPAAVPLAVRSPYLSTWLPQGNGTALNEGWSQFWDTNVSGSIRLCVRLAIAVARRAFTSTYASLKSIGWTGLARVDGQAYVWMGKPNVSNADLHNATQKSMNVSSALSSRALATNC